MLPDRLLNIQVIGWVFALMRLVGKTAYGKNIEGSTWRCNYVPDADLVTGPQPVT